MRNVTPEQVAMAEQHRRGELPDRIEGALGELAGAAKEGLMALSVGVLTVVPALAVLGIGFRLGEMVWFGWLGIFVLRTSQSAAARTVRAFFGARDGVRRDVGRRFSAGLRLCKRMGQIVTNHT